MNKLLDIINQKTSFILSAILGIKDLDTKKIDSDIDNMREQNKVLSEAVNINNKKLFKTNQEIRRVADEALLFNYYGKLLSKAYVEFNFIDHLKDEDIDTYRFFIDDAVFNEDDYLFVKNHSKELRQMIEDNDKDTDIYIPLIKSLEGVINGY